MKYTINGKQYTEFDINKRCAEIEKMPIVKIFQPCNPHVNIGGEDWFRGYNPCNNWDDAGPIIEKCFDELMAAPCFFKGLCMTKWECIIDEWECTKLIAACICLIGLNE
jgi:hypothetical protein